METLNRKTIISNSVSKYINKIFNLSDIRKAAPSINSENYVKILRQHHSTPWDKVAQSEEYDMTAKYRDWSPLFRFDATKVINSLFGSADSDMQNLYNSFTHARNSLNGILVHTNNFNNITTERRASHDNSTPSFTSYFELFLQRLRADFSCTTELLDHCELDWAIASLESCNPIRKSKKSNSDNVVKNNLKNMNTTLSKLFSNARDSSNRHQVPWRDGQRDLLPPSALMFKITETEPRYTYGLNGSRNNTIPYNSTMRQKDGYYFAIDVGNYDPTWNATKKDIPEYIQDLINTGIFGHVETQNLTQAKHMNVIILKTTAKFTVTNSVSNGSHSGHGGVYSPIRLENDTSDEKALTSLMACKSPLDTGSSNTTTHQSVTVGPLIHVIHPVSFKNFIMTSDAFGSTDKKLFNLDSPVNKQEWFNLKEDCPDSHPSTESRNYFSSELCAYTPYLEPKNNVIRDNTSVLNFHTNTGSADHHKAPLHLKQFYSTSPAFTNALIDAPLYGWTCTNVNCENLPNLVKPANGFNWTSAARPIPGPVDSSEVNGMLTSDRTCNDVNKERRVKWTWTNAKNLNPETKHTLNIKECFMDYAVTYDPTDLGNGKVYVDQDNIAHCPLSGDALMCSTFIVGKDSHRYDSWRSNNLFIHKV